MCHFNIPAIKKNHLTSSITARKSIVLLQMLYTNILRYKLIYKLRNNASFINEVWLGFGFIAIVH